MSDTGERACCDADGVPLKVGAWVDYVGGSAGWVVDLTYDRNQVLVKYETGYLAGRTAGAFPSNLRHAPPPEVKPCPYGKHQMANFKDRCANCGMTGAEIAGEVRASERVKTWTHQCQGQQSWMLDAGRDCERCWMTWEQAVARCSYVMKEPSERALEETVCEATPAGCKHCGAEVDQMGVSCGDGTYACLGCWSDREQVELAAFDAAVTEYLVPLLPKGLRCVTDSCDGNKGSFFACWVLDGNREVCVFRVMQSQFSLYGPESLAGYSKQVAVALMRAALGEPPL